MTERDEIFSHRWFEKVRNKKSEKAIDDRNEFDFMKTCAQPGALTLNL